MKKLLVIALVFASTTALFAQEDFYSSTWKIDAFVSVLRGDSIVFYTKGGSENILDYSKTEFQFSSDGTYTGTNNDGEESSGTCVFDVEKDTIVIDGNAFKLIVLDEDHFISRGYSMEIVDAEANEDTSYNYLKLYRVTIATGISNDINSKEYINVFPNPANHLISISSASANTVIKEIRIATTYGKQVALYTGIDKSSTDINIADLANGLYVVEITDQAGNRITRKVAKQ